MAFDPRMVPDLPFADYLADGGYGSSDLHAFRLGPPAIVPYRRANRDAGTEATRIGTAAHCLILTPELFADTFSVKPDGMKFSTNSGKAWRDAQGRRTILTPGEGARVRDAADAFMARTAAADSLARAEGIEASLFWTCRHTGLPCKGRPDWFDGECVYDLKVSIAANKPEESLRYAAAKNGWLHQLAHNRDGLRACGHFVKRGRLVVIAPTREARLRTWLLEVTENDMDFLALANEQTRGQMMACHTANRWPGTPDEWTAIELPSITAFEDVDLIGAMEAPTDEQ